MYQPLRTTSAFVIGTSSFFGALCPTAYPREAPAQDAPQWYTNVKPILPSATEADVEKYLSDMDRNAMVLGQRVQFPLPHTNSAGMDPSDYQDNPVAIGVGPEGRTVRVTFGVGTQPTGDGWEKYRDFTPECDTMHRALKRTIVGELARNLGAPLTQSELYSIYPIYSGIPRQLFQGNCPADQLLRLSTVRGLVIPWGSPKPHKITEVNFPQNNASIGALVDAIVESTSSVLNKRFPGATTQECTAVAAVLTHEYFRDASALSYAFAYSKAKASQLCGKAIFVPDVASGVTQLEEQFVLTSGIVTRAVDKLEVFTREIPPLLQTSAPEVKFGVLSRDLSFGDGLYREVVRLESSDGHSETFTWSGPIPLGYYRILQDHPHVLDLCDISLAMREIGHIAANGNPTPLPLDVAMCNPFEAIPAIQHTVAREICSPHALDATMASLGKGLFTSNWNELCKLINFDSYGSHTIPMRAQSDFARLGDDDFKKTRESLYEDQQRYLNSFVVSETARQVIEYVNTLPDGWRHKRFKFFDGGLGLVEEVTYNELKLKNGTDAQKESKNANADYWETLRWDPTGDINGNVRVTDGKNSKGVVTDATVVKLFLTSDCSRYIAQYSLGHARYKYGQLGSRYQVSSSVIVEGETGALRPELVALMDARPDALRKLAPDLAGLLEDSDKNVGISIARAAFFSEEMLDGIQHGFNYNAVTPGDIDVGQHLASAALDMFALRKDRYPTIFATHAFVDALNNRPPERVDPKNRVKGVGTKINKDRVTQLLDKWHAAKLEAIELGKKNGAAQVTKLKAAYQEATKDETVVAIGMTWGGPVPIIALSFGFKGVMVGFALDLGSTIRISPTINDFKITSIIPALREALGPRKSEMPVFYPGDLQGFPEYQYPAAQPPTSGAKPTLKDTKIVPGGNGAELHPGIDPGIPSFEQLSSPIEKWQERVGEALDRSGEALQPLSSSRENALCDEYTVRLKLPNGLTADDIFDKLQRDFNAGVSDLGFSLLADFERRDKIEHGKVRVGDIYDLSSALLGPRQLGGVAIPRSSIIIVDTQFNSFTVHTLKGHQEAGVRAFGWIRNPDGTVTFYTRGVSEIGANFPANALPPGAVRSVQSLVWHRYLVGVGNYVLKRGGEVVKNSEETNQK